MNEEKSALNKLPDGSPAPVFRCVAVGFDGEKKTLDLTEWWWEGVKVETIEESTESYFYNAFDKGSFDVISITKL
ncbi:MAG: hypothetical protein GY814_01720 [Gammaproteobacteria bacterium]|nr:hypothetical protein [Gammaproteobacteria bacterium]